MNLIKKIAMLAALSLAAVSASAEDIWQEETSSLGVKAGYISKNHGMMIGAFYQYTVSPNFRISPEASIMLRNRNRSGANLDLNFHFPIDLGTDVCNVYPLAGINYSRWREHTLLDLPIGEVSKTYGRVGVNLGGGFEIYTKGNIKLRVEVKGLITSKYTTAVLDGGVAYIF